MEEGATKPACAERARYFAFTVAAADVASEVAEPRVVRLADEDRPLGYGKKSTDQPQHGLCPKPRQAALEALAQNTDEVDKLRRERYNNRAKR